MTNCLLANRLKSHFLLELRKKVEVLPEGAQAPAAPAAWVQPTGAQDAYAIGARVTFNGSVYESKINANVWSPTAYPAGWKLV